MNNYSNPVTVTGNPASFEASGNGKLLSLSVPFSPIQSLNGYSSPWPGGGGKNKCDYLNSDNLFIATSATARVKTSNIGTISISGNDVTLTRTAEAAGLCVVFKGLEANTEYCFSEVYNNMVSYYYYGKITWIDDTSYTSERIGSNSHTFTTTDAGDYEVLIWKTGKGAIDIQDAQLELGTTPTAFVPYSNICPITGRTGLNVYRTGKNLLGGSTLGQAIATAVNNQTYSWLGSDSNGNFVTVKASAVVDMKSFTDSLVFKANTVYTIILKLTRYQVGSAMNSNVVIKYTDGTTTQMIFAADTATEVVTKAFTSATGKTIKSIQTTWGGGTTYLYYDECGIFEGNLAVSDFEPYSGNTYAVDWTTEAGTVYGGTLDVVTGVLTVDRATVTLNGSETWGTGNPISKQGCYTALHSLKKLTDYKSAISCNELKTYASYSKQEYIDAEYGISGYRDSLNTYPGQNWLYIKINGLSTTDEYKTWLASNNLQVVYPLATPLTYQLTATQVELLIGQNNVWSDSNEAVTLTYVIKLFTRYTFKVNNNDYSQFVERDSYVTELTPVFGETIKTMDGVNHTALLRLRGSITVGLNPQTKANTAAICADILQSPVEVQYHCLQRNANVTALMVADTISAQFLSRCLANGDDWNKIEEITLTEL